MEVSYGPPTLDFAILKLDYRLAGTNRSICDSKVSPVSKVPLESFDYLFFRCVMLCYSLMS